MRPILPIAITKEIPKSLEATTENGSSILAKKLSVLFLLVSLIFFFVISEQAKADHFQGGYFTYKDLGGGKYEFLIKGYWKKNGVATLYLRYRGGAIINSSSSVSKTLLPDGETVEHVQKEIVTWPSPGFYEVYYNPCCMGTGSNYENNRIGIFATVNYDPSVPSSAPVLYDFPLYNYQAGAPIYHKFDIKDPDGHEQEFSLEVPNGLTSDAYTAMKESGFELRTDGTMVWENPIVGKWLVHIRVREKINGVFTGTYVDKLFIMKVSDSADNQPPVFTSIETKTVRLGDALNFEVGASDMEGQNVTIIGYGTPFENGAAFTQTVSGSAAKGTITWTPSEVGSHTIHFMAADDHTTKMYSRMDLNIEVVECLEISSGYEIKKPCAGSTNGIISLNGSGGNGLLSYSIDNGASFQSLPDFENLAAGTYTALIRDEVGCLSSPQTILLEEAPLPAISFDLPAMICASEPGIELEGLPSGGLYEGPGVENGFFYPDLAGVGTHSITYIYTDNNGCSNFVVEEITVREVPVAYAGEDTDVYIKKNGGTSGKSCITLTGIATGSASAYTYSWSTGETTQSIEVCPTITTTYILTVSDEFGCSDTSHVTVSVYENNDKPKKEKEKDKTKGSKARLDNLANNGFSPSTESIVLYPNPIIDKSQLSITLEDTELLKVDIIDLSGKVIKNLFSGNQQAHDGITLDVDNNLNSKTSYLCRVVTSTNVYFLRIIIP